MRPNLIHTLSASNGRTKRSGAFNIMSRNVVVAGALEIPVTISLPQSGVGTVCKLWMIVCLSSFGLVGLNIGPVALSQAAETGLSLGEVAKGLVGPSKNSGSDDRSHGGQRHWSFCNDIEPILSKYGCNGSACHGKAEGQNGFRLTVFGFDAEADFIQITKDTMGRRVNTVAPEQSLLLLKATSSVGHGGGGRLHPDQEEYEVLKDWIAAGAPWGHPDDPTLISIDVQPDEAVLAVQATQSLQVMAHWSDGHQSDVTRLALYQSNRPGLAQVDEGGMVKTGTAPGVAAIMASYLGQVDLFQAVIPRPTELDEDPKADFERESLQEIDRLVARRLKLLRIRPSSPVSDETFVRRVYLDILGTLPTAKEARAHLTDPRPDRRAQLVDDLLQRPEYGDYWAQKWSDLLRVDRKALGHQRAYEYYRWIQDSFATNKPLDVFAREIVQATGPVDEVPAAHFYHAVSQPNEMASTLSQTFLGVRITCAECHHHPYDRWGQIDYFGMQAFFTQVQFQPSAIGEIIVDSGTSTTKHPRTEEEIYAHALGEPMPSEMLSGDRRQVFADWLTSPDNPWFARNLANRLWAHFMGRGLVEPVDDVRLTNPPTNPELLDLLAETLIEHEFDQHDMIRVIVLSDAYQRSCGINETNEDDRWNYSRFPFKRLEAEVLLDAVCQVTGIPEKYAGMPLGTRAVQLWDSQVTNEFLGLFGRPVRTTVCSCERTIQPTVSQVLHLMNSPRLHNKLSNRTNVLTSLVNSLPDNEAILDELYLTLFCRFPNDEEIQFGSQFLVHADDRRQAIEDLAWGMMNSLEFAFNH